MMEDFKTWWKLYSVKLAALVSAASAVLTANPELVTGLLAIIPIDPLPRLIMAAGVGAVVFLFPFLARIWPQNVETPNVQSSDETEA